MHLSILASTSTVTLPTISKPHVFSLATEIRCQEMSKGGLAYEVILAEPVGVPVPRRADSPEKTPSVEEIQEKLKAAEERRRVSETSASVRYLLHIRLCFLIVTTWKPEGKGERLLQGKRSSSTASSSASSFTIRCDHCSKARQIRLQHPY